MSYYVFSDVDETLIRVKSMIAFMDAFLCNSSFINDRFFFDKQIKLKTIVQLAKNKSTNRQDLNRDFYYLFEGISKTILECEALCWVYTMIKNNDFFIEKVLDELREHQAREAKIVLVSGSFKEILTPIMSHIKADYLICSELELKNGFYTGRLLKQVIGKGKWQAIQEYIYDKNVDLSACYAYGDHKSDLCFMNKVGYPVLVGDSEEMVPIAKEKGWTIIKN